MNDRPDPSEHSPPSRSEAAEAGDAVLVADLRARWPIARPFVVAGAACVVAGGLVAAASRPTGFEEGPWVAAFLVLVGGVAQVSLGAGRAWLAAAPDGRTAARLTSWAWNVGGVTTIAGTLAEAPLITTVGGLVISVALVLFLVGVRRARASGGWLLAVYRGLIAVVLVSVPIGLVLSWSRHG